MMKIVKITLDKNKLIRMTQQDKVLFFLLAHMSNEITILGKILAWSTQNPNETNDVETLGRDGHTLFLLRLLMAKLYETHKTLKKITADSFTYKKMSNQWRKAMDGINNFFKASITFKTVRDKMSFHNDLKYAKDGLVNFPSGSDFLIFSDEQGIEANTYFRYADAFANYSMIRAHSSDISKRSADVILSDTLRISRSCRLVLGECLAELVCRNQVGMHRESIEISDAPRFETVTLPYFTEVDRDRIMARFDP